MKPTVSASTTPVPPGSAMRRTVGIERREQLVGDVGVGAGERVEQRRLAGVGVADERDATAPESARALRAPGLALLRDLLEALAEQRSTRLPMQAAVGLELRFAGTAQADAAALALEVGPAAHQARGHVLELRELDLQLAFVAARALREDVEDQAGAVEHAALE